jgi:hypothetical protein
MKSWTSADEEISPFALTFFFSPTGGEERAGGIFLQKERRDNMRTFEGCPGSRMMTFRKDVEEVTGEATGKSELRQWPIQMHLISPTAPYYQGADVLLTADCVGYALGSFHPDFLKGKSLAIACPKLDEGQDTYLEKIKSWFEDAKINTLTVLIMQVPCCLGLLNLAKRAAQEAKRNVPIKYVVVGLQGDILQEGWTSA